MATKGQHSDDQQALDALLKKSQSSSSFLPDELSYLISAYLPSQPPTHRSKAYLVLASFCQGVRSSSSPAATDKLDPATESLSKIFAPLVLSRLAEQTESDALIGISFLTALFQVDWQTALDIFQQDGTVEFAMDITDLFPASPLLSLEVAHLLGQASGHKAARSIVSSQSQCLEWLGSQSRQTKNSAVRAAAAMTLVKLSRGATTNTEDSTGSTETRSFAREDELVKLMKALVVDSENQSSLSDAIEGLAYLSVDPTVKETLSKDSSFLMKLFAVVPRRRTTSQALPEYNTTLLYGILAIMSNICAYKPRLNEEQAQIAKLRHMANAGKNKSAQDSTHLQENVLEDDEHVKQRGHRLIKSGALDVLAAIVSLTDSRGARVAASKAYLSLVEDKGNRGKILQSGGSKALMLLIRTAMTGPSPSSGSSQTSPTLDTSDLDAIQALAKLAITASPVQVFGPNEGATYDAIRPFTLMLLHSSATLLQRFEALMALTNLSSQSPETASRIAGSHGLLNKVELLLLEEHPLVRRAAMELICNLIAGSEEVFERYGGSETGAAVKSKLQVLLALSDVEDLPTRLAASGALATLTSAPTACHALYSLHLERHRVLPILTQLIDPSAALDSEDAAGNDIRSDPGLVHRGVICARNFLLGMVQDKASRKNVAKEAEKVGLVRALVDVVKAGGAGEAVLRPTAEALKFLMEFGKD